MRANKFLLCRSFSLVYLYSTITFTFTLQCKSHVEKLALGEAASNRTRLRVIDRLPRSLAIYRRFENTDFKTVLNRVKLWFSHTTTIPLPFGPLLLFNPFIVSEWTSWLCGCFIFIWLHDSTGLAVVEVFTTTLSRCSCLKQSTALLRCVSVVLPARERTNWSTDSLACHASWLWSLRCHPATSLPLSVWGGGYDHSHA